MIGNSNRPEHQFLCFAFLAGIGYSSAPSMLPRTAWSTTVSNNGILYSVTGVNLYNLAPSGRNYYDSFDLL
jgi:hypothetical protein